MLYEKEIRIAVNAVRRASILTAKIQKQIIANRSSTTITKSDESPVTIADYAAQAIVLNAIKANFPQDEIVAEESTEGLSESFLNNILSTINEYAPKEDDETLFNEDIALSNSEYPLKTTNDVQKIINFGDSKGGAKTRFWCLDPIDGTKGFLRGEQFAVCLALIEDGEVKLGCIGCPNLKLNDYVTKENSINVANPLNRSFRDPEQFGYIFYAVAGEDHLSYLHTTDVLSGSLKSVAANEFTVSESKNLVSLEGVEKGHSSHDNQQIIKDHFHIDKSLHLDSQVKYCLLALGLGHVYLRLPTSMTFEEKIWDHAAGNALIRAVRGNHTSSLSAEPLDFSQGRTLKTKGVIASIATPELHKEIVSFAENVINKN
ncbi:hypothetical protein ACO0QE_003498 [Hanseniaspora vineae]